MCVSAVLSIGNDNNFNLHFFINNFNVITSDESSWPYLSYRKRQRFYKKLITSDESWIYEYSQKNWQTRNGKYSSKEARMTKSKIKLMFNTSFQICVPRTEIQWNLLLESKWDSSMTKCNSLWMHIGYSCGTLLIYTGAVSCRAANTQTWYVWLPALFL